MNEVELSDGRTITLRPPTMNDLSAYVQFDIARQAIKSVFDAVESIRAGVIVPIPDIGDRIQHAYPLMARLSGLSEDEIRALPVDDNLKLINGVIDVMHPKAERKAERPAAAQTEQQPPTTT